MRQHLFCLLDCFWFWAYIKLPFVSISALGDYDGHAISIYGRTLSKEETPKAPIVESAPEQSIPHISSDQELSKKRLFASFSEPECQIEPLCGGKGASLGFLTSLSVAERRSSQYPQYIVPNGFVLSTNAYDLQLERHQNLKEATVAVEDQAFKRKPGSLIDTCKQTIELFKGTVIEPETVQAILHIFDVLQENYRNVSHFNEVGFRLAVRSSAIGEDSSETSSAGQNDTFLGCSSTDDVLNAVKSCWASLYSHQSVVYRHQNSQPIRTQMAVVIQTMVPSDSAGVLFTHYPLNKNPYKILITANYGLGEVRMFILYRICGGASTIHYLFFFSCSLWFLERWTRMFILFSGATKKMLLQFCRRM